MPDFRYFIRFISRTGRSKGDNTTEQITYSCQEAEAVADRWVDTALRVGYTWTGSVQDAQDICQTVLLKLLTRPERFSEPDRERAWVPRITINCCKDLKKSVLARKRVPLDTAERMPVCLHAGGRGKPCAGGGAGSAGKVPAGEEYKLEEIAALMGCRTAQISTYLYQGKAKLRTMLGGSYERECLSD